VVIGNLNKNTLTSVYFYKLDLANIVPTSVPNANLINSIARTIGLHDFYQYVGTCLKLSSRDFADTSCKSRPLGLLRGLRQ
jgi:hypothetical protein